LVRQKGFAHLGGSSKLL